MAECKEQILNSIPNNNCCIHAFFNVIFNSAEKLNNSYLISAPNFVIDFAAKLINKHYPNAEINIWNGFLSVSKDIYDIEVEFEQLNLSHYDNACDRLTILKTLFLLNGNLYYNSDNFKNSKGYNLEFVFKNEEKCQICHTILAENGFNLKEIKRQNNFVLYTKNSNTICDLLVLLGATYSALDLQNSLAMREVRNSTNRQNNCFGHNLDKTLNSSDKQLEAINYLYENDLLDSLDENLKEIALLRFANPEVSLNELKILLNKPISRAGLKYRLDKIIEIYKLYKENAQ